MDVKNINKYILLSLLFSQGAMATELNLHKPTAPHIPETTEHPLHLNIPVLPLKNINSGHIIKDHGTHHCNPGNPC